MGVLEVQHCDMTRSIDVEIAVDQLRAIPCRVAQSVVNLADPPRPMPRLDRIAVQRFGLSYR